MIYTIGDYKFDSERFIIYQSNIDQNVIEKNFTHNSDDTVLQELMKQNPDEMCMDKIAIDNAGICLTYNCNLRCKYCGYSSTSDDTNKLDFCDIKIFLADIIKKRTIKKLITKKNEPLTLYFTGGGEPTYEWGLFKNVVTFIKQQCEDKNIPVTLGMTTNGMLSNDQIEFISENFNYVMISYDGLPEIQNSNRTSPTLKATNSIVENSISEMARNNVAVNIRTTIWQSDYFKLKEMYDHVFSLAPLDSKITWSIYPALFEGRAVEHIAKQEDMTYKSFLTYYVDLVGHIISKEGVEKIKKIDVPLFDNRICELFCGAHRKNHPWLLPDKSIVTCIESKDDKVFIGKIDNGKVEYFQKYTDNLLRITQEKFSKCKNCIAYRICKGGCPIWHLRINENMREPLECHLQKEYMIYVLNAVLSKKYSFDWSLEEICLPDIKNQEVFKLVKK